MREALHSFILQCLLRIERVEDRLMNFSRSYLKQKSVHGVEVQTIHVRIGNPLRHDDQNPATPPNDLFQYELGNYNQQLNIRRVSHPLDISVLVKWLGEGYIYFAEAGGAWKND